jgi:transposase
LKSYPSYSCHHGLCNSHHLRELTFVYERHDPIWPDQMIDLLLKMKKQVELAKDAGKSSLEPDNLAQLEKDYQRILDLGFAANLPSVPDPEAPKKRGRPKQTVPKNLLDRLQAKQTEVLRFLHDFAVPFDNNLAERDLRMMKLEQKISGVFRSEAGTQQFCRIRGHISTLRKQGRDVMDALTQVFMETPVSSLPE